jgi:hypothetical protein
MRVRNKEGYFVFLAAGASLLSEKFGIFIAQKIQSYLKWRGFEKPPYAE